MMHSRISHIETNGCVAPLPAAHLAVSLPPSTVTGRVPFGFTCSTDATSVGTAEQVRKGLRSGQGGEERSALPTRTNHTPSELIFALLQWENRQEPIKVSQSYLFFLYVWVFACVYVCIPWAYMSTEARRHLFLRTGIPDDGCELPCGFSEPNQGPLQV